MVLAVLPCRASAPQDAPELSAALARAFPEADAFPARVATLDEPLRAKLAPTLRAPSAPRLWTYREARRAGVLLGRAVQGDVLGKTQPITYLVLLEPDNAVRAVEVLEYRESHGGEVRREKWRAQFRAKRAGEPWKLGADVKNIAGATLSCRALLDAVHDVVVLAAAVFPEPARAPGAHAPVDRANAPMDRAHAQGESGQRAGAEPAARVVSPAGAAVLQRAQLAMGTLLELRAAGVERAAFDAACDAAFARVAALEAAWSTWRETSELSRLNASEPGVWCALSEPTVQLLARAARLRRASGGAFAAESGPLVELWREAERSGQEPSAAELDRARAAAAAEAIELDLASRRARRVHPGARLDLGGIGKGAALDAVAQEFAARGLERALFDFGGQLHALDGPSPGRGWPVEIRDPRPGARAPLWHLELERAALATSADDQRGLDVAGRKLSHVVDPRTGRPASAHWTACVLVPAPAGEATSTAAERADAWSTAAFVLERAACEPRAGAHGLALFVLEHDGTAWTAGPFPGRKGEP